MEKVLNIMFGRAVLILTLLAVSFVLPLHAQDVSFTASVDRNQVGTGEQFQLTFALNNSSGAKNFRAPSLNDFLILSGPNQSTNMQFINGQMSSSISYSYILQPRAEGKFSIGSATIEYEGRQLETKPIAITVTKETGQRPQAQQRGGAQDDTDISKQIGDNLFLRVRIDKSKAFQGEQITATYKIYTRVSVVNYSITKVPALTGFWSEDLEMPKQIQLSDEIVDGKQYRVGILKKVALFPQRSGTLEIDPMEVECIVQVRTRRPSNDIFDQFFSDPFFGNVHNVNYKVRSEPARISIQELPMADAPEGFSGAVGKFSMEAWLDKRETKTNEPITLRVKVSGRGNLKLLEAPHVNVPPDMEGYDPKISDNISKQNDRISGSRTFEYLLIPRHPGDLKIPSFPFSYFDLERKSFVKLTSPEFAVRVERGADIVSNVAPGVNREDVRMLGEDIRFIKSGEASFQKKGSSFIGSGTFVALSVSPVLAFVGFLFIIRRRERMLGDVVSMKIRRARKMAQRRLNLAKTYLQEKKREEFYAETSRALWGYISDKLGIPPAELSLDSVKQSLASRGVTEEAIQRLSETLEKCEFARFAPSVDSLEMDAVYRNSIDVISSIEDQIR